MPAKVLFIDVETSPLISYTWGIWQENIGLNQIKEDWHLLAFSAKWLGAKNIIYQDQSEAKHIENDKPLVKSIWHLLDDADIVVSQNGASFDIPKIKARMLFHKIKPHSPFKQVDTLRVAKHTFGFTSNKLEYMSEKFTDAPKDKHKEFPGFELWKECLKGNKRAWAEMRKYNIQDTIALEKLYLEMQPWISKHPNMGMFVDAGGSVCPKCGSNKIEKRGYFYTSVGLYQRYHCRACGGWSHGRTILNSKEDRKIQLSN